MGDMKKLLLAAALAAGATAAHAQSVSVGLKAGVSLANFVGKDVDESKLKAGANAGVALELGLSNGLALQPELLYSMKGARAEDQNLGIKYTTTLHYVDVPVLIKLNAGGPFFELGPQVGFLLGVKNTREQGTTTVSDTNKSAYKTTDVGAVVGVGYHFGSGPSIGVRYNPGLTRFQTTERRVYNSAFMFQLGYWFQ